MPDRMLPQSEFPPAQPKVLDDRPRRCPPLVLGEGSAQSPDGCSIRCRRPGDPPSSTPPADLVADRSSGKPWFSFRSYPPHPIPSTHPALSTPKVESEQLLECRGI